MEKKKLLIVGIYVAVVVCLVLFGPALLLGINGITMNLLLTFIAFGIAAILVDSKSTIVNFIKDFDNAVGGAVIVAQKEIDKIAADVSAESKKKLKELIDYAQAELAKLEAKL